MKIFNKNRKSFGNNNNRRNDRNNSYRSNDRNNKFGRKNGGRNKFIKSEQFHEEEDATPWHVMKQNLKPSIAIKNPEIEDDWNAGGKQKSNAAKQEFMRQKDERHRKFVIENERKTVSKWDSFSDVEQSEDKAKRNESDVGQIVENELMECEIKETGSDKKSFKKVETSEDHASKKTKLKHKKVSQEKTIVEDENVQPAVLKKKSKKTTKHVESSQELNFDITVEQPVKKKSKKTTKHVESSQPQELDIDFTVKQPVKKKSKKTVEQGVSPQEIIIENAIESTNTAKKKSKKKDKQAESHDQTELPSVPEIPSSHKNEKKTLNIEKPEESFLESLAAQKQNEPLLFESTEIMKSGPRCFACRQFGHSLKQCRDFDNTSSRICIKCGSNEHAYQNCTVHKGRVFKFASCFICKQTGHISSQCKEKKNGVYPDGGNCRYCSSIEHLGFNCPKRPGRKKKRKFTKNHNSKPNDKFRKVQAGGGGGGGRGGPGRIQKNDKIKKNFK